MKGDCKEAGDFLDPGGNSYPLSRAEPECLLSESPDVGQTDGTIHER